MFTFNLVIAEIEEAPSQEYGGVHNFLTMWGIQNNMAPIVCHEQVKMEVHKELGKLYASMLSTLGILSNWGP